MSRPVGSWARPDPGQSLSSHAHVRSAHAASELAASAPAFTRPPRSRGWDQPQHKGPALPSALESTQAPRRATFLQPGTRRAEAKCQPEPGSRGPASGDPGPQVCYRSQACSERFCSHSPALEGQAGGRALYALAAPPRPCPTLSPGLHGPSPWTGWPALSSRKPCGCNPVLLLVASPSVHGALGPLGGVQAPPCQTPL